MPVRKRPRRGGEEAAHQYGFDLAYASALPYFPCYEPLFHLLSSAWERLGGKAGGVDPFLSSMAMDGNVIVGFMRKGFNTVGVIFFQLPRNVGGGVGKDEVSTRVHLIAVDPKREDKGIGAPQASRSVRSQDNLVLFLLSHPPRSLSPCLLSPFILPHPPTHSASFPAFLHVSCPSHRPVTTYLLPILLPLLPRPPPPLPSQPPPPHTPNPLRLPSHSLSPSPSPFPPLERIAHPSLLFAELLLVCFVMRCSSFLGIPKISVRCASHSQRRSLHPLALVEAPSSSISAVEGLPGKEGGGGVVVVGDVEDQMQQSEVVGLEAGQLAQRLLDRRGVGGEVVGDELPVHSMIAMWLPTE